MNLTCIIFSTATFFDDKICRIPTGSRKDSLECRLYIEQNYRECRPYWKRIFWATEIGLKASKLLTLCPFQNTDTFKTVVHSKITSMFFSKLCVYRPVLCPNLFTYQDPNLLLVRFFSKVFTPQT